jgi:NADH dehydrogenase (ubiquinone) 1 beta subcomplex subunit 7
MGSSNESTMKVSKEEMKKAGIDLAYRDFCAHLLIPLNECRRKSFFLPGKCGDERHVYEKCQYEECVFRCCCFLSVVAVVVVVLFSGLSLVFDERARVSCFVRCVFFPEREREREKRGTFSRLAN